MRKVLLSLSLLIAGAMSVWAQQTAYLVKEATTTLTDGTYVLVAMTSHGTGPCYYSSAESGNRLYRYNTNMNVQVGGCIDDAKYIWTVNETTTDGVQKITVTNVGDPTKAFPVDGGKNQNFTGSVVAELITEKHTIEGVDYFALTLEDSNIGYVHANAPGGNPNLSYWNSYADDGTCVKFRFYPVENIQLATDVTSGAYYRLMCVSPKAGNGGDASYNTLTWNGESHLVTRPMDMENDNQVFMFEDAGDGTYYLKNLVAGKYLNKINQGGYRSAVVDKADACKLDVSPYEGVVGQFKLHNSESTNDNHCLFAENHPTETVPYACSGWNDGANSPSAWRLVSVSLETLFGAGTEASPYLINNVDDLILFRNSVNAGETTYNAEGVYVALGANIDLAGQDWSVNIGDDCNATFDGIFDGKGFTISNLTSTETAKKADGYICTGLFGAIAGNAVVKNLTIENVTIDAQYVGNNASAVVGFAWKASGSIENVTVTGNININASAVTGVGAILGYDYYSPALKVENCEVIGSEGSSIVGGAAYVGGVVGYASSYIAINNNTVENLSITATGSAAAVAGIMLAGSSADGNTVTNVTVTTNGPLWANSAAAVAGTITKGGITVSNTTVENVTANGAEADIVGGILVEKPTEPIAKIEAKAGNKYYTTIELAMADKDNDDAVECLVEKNITLNDGEAYTYTKSVSGENVSVEYTRTLIAGIWNPIYLPFEAGLNINEFEVAEFTSAEGTTVTLTKLSADNEEGDLTLEPNKAYVVRPVGTNNDLQLGACGSIYSNEEKSWSLGEGFSVRGNYNVLTGAKLAATDRVVGSNGNWGVLKSTSTLKPYRLILSVPESFSAEQNAISFSMRVLDNTTGVEETIFDGQETIVIFDLMGRRVESITDGGIYIVNGKKMIR